MTETSIPSSAVTTSSSYERDHQVTQMRANFSIEGIEPREDDLTWQHRYIEGTASLADMLQHARDYAGSRTHPHAG
jgi:hypothetical protein